MMEKLARQIKDRELEELFPDTDPSQVRQQPAKLREAIFQVHGIVYNEELYNYTENHSEITSSKLEELAKDQEQLKRIKKAMKGSTLSTNEKGETVIPVRDIRYALTKKTIHWD